MTPRAWRIEPDYVVICYVEGPKIRYERDFSSEYAVYEGGVRRLERASNEFVPVKHNPRIISPPLQKLPVRKNRSKKG
jgi:hypothetical protein